MVGCWQFLAIRRERQELGVDPEPKVEIAFYACSRPVTETPTAKLARIVRRHWGAVENGAHHRRDVTFHEDQSRIRHRGAAQIMATQRNLALSLYELNAARHEPEDGEDLGKAKLGFTVWRDRLKAGAAIALIRR